MKIYSPWEKAFHKVYTPFEQFIHAQTTTGLVLIVMTIFALVISNGPFSNEYQDIIHSRIDIVVGPWQLSHSVHEWINDGLMAIFFFLVGLEIKREVLVGELSHIKVAILPIVAAFGGMVVPALIYFLINMGGAGIDGWGIPMATDIAFAISALILLKNRVSSALVAFLVALAIVDDLGAVLIIALFYTEQIHTLPLLLSFISFLIMISFNRFGIRELLPYFVLAIAMWLFMLESGVHATVAGVITAFSIPSRPNMTPTAFTAHTRNLLDEYDNYPVATDFTMHEKQKAILQNIMDRINSVGSPSYRLEHSLQLPVSLIIIPLFALANAGISIEFSSIGTSILEPVTLGVIFGLIFGKMLGIVGASYMAVKFKIAALPDKSSMSQIFGVSALAGIGFTMSIFVSELAFSGDIELIYQAKIGILIASVFSGLFGFIWLMFVAKGRENT